MLPVIPCCIVKEVPFGNGVFLRCLLGDLVTPKILKVHPVHAYFLADSVFAARCYPMHKRGLCWHAVSVRPSVPVCLCLSRSYIPSQRVIVSFTILVFPYQTSWQLIFRGGNGDSGRIPGYRLVTAGLRDQQ